MDTLQQHASQHTSEFNPAPVQTQLTSAMNLLMLGTASGMLLHWLVWDRIGGSLGMFVWTVLSCAAMLWLNRHQNKVWRLELLGWSMVINCAALLAMLRDADQVMLLMFLVMLLSLGMMLYRSRGDLLANATLPRVFMTAFSLPARILLSIFPAVDTVIKSTWRGGSQISAVFRGVLLAAPLLFIFVLLFASADAVFNQQLQRIGDLMNALTPTTPLITLILIVLATGLLSCSVMQNRQSVDGSVNHQPQQLWPGMRVTLGQTETAILMGSLALLFTTFVILQTSYLFGGRELIEVRSGLTLADYARRGFFELLMVAVLTTGVLMALASVQCHQGLFRRLGGVLIVCVLIMLLSSIYRLNLYVEQFGLTMARVVALSVMLWLGISLLGFAATVLRGNSRGFLAGMVISGMACCLLLGVINPASTVASININHALSQNSRLDLDYLSRLGADVVPEVLDSLSEATAPEYFCRVVIGTYSRWYNDARDWRDWNAARAAAHQRFMAHLETC